MLEDISFPGEEWKPLNVSPESHFVSNYGRMFQLGKQGRKAAIKTFIPSKHYPTYLLRIKGKTTLISLSTIMREHWKFEFIKDLDDGEECKQIIGYPDYYVTNRGRVFSMFTYKWQNPDNVFDYYYRTTLNRQSKFIHTLVGRHFLPDYREGLLICHKEETLSFPEINFVDNLWVGTHSENTQDGFKKGRCYSGNKGMRYKLK